MFKIVKRGLWWCSNLHPRFSGLYPLFVFIGIQLIAYVWNTKLIPKSVRRHFVINYMKILKYTK